MNQLTLQIWNTQVAVRKQLTRILDLLIENGADYIAWANRGHYAEPEIYMFNRLNG